MKLKPTYLLTLAICLLTALSCSQGQRLERTYPVDPFIGTGGHGHVFLGASVPFGMVQLGPQQPEKGWDWCSGYHISSSNLVGFSHTRLSGTGIGENGDVLMLPYNPELPMGTTEEGLFCVNLNHDAEVAAPGYYSVELDGGIKVELTASERIGIQKYTFDCNSLAVHLDLTTGVGWDAITECGFKVLSNNMIAGWRRSSGWAKDHVIYFVSKFSLPLANASELPSEVVGEKFTAELLFNTADDRELVVTTALSPNSIEAAIANMKADAASGDFELCHQQATRKWNDALGKIWIEGLDPVQEKVFYTSLYHTMIAPSLFGDAADAQKEYTFLSLWDVYRAEFPLMTLIHPELCSDIVSTFMKIYERQGRLPVWHLNRNETDCMVGNPGSVVLADLFLKGFVKDRAAALEALKITGMTPGRGQELLIEYGYIPYDKSAELETVSKGLEFAVADAGVARVATAMGDVKVAEYFGERGRAYAKYYDPSVGFVRGRAADGSFREPFDPFIAPHMKSDFTEGNAWQYTFSVPHDAHGLIELLGGEKAFGEKLDEFFVAEGDLGDDANDVTGLIGQYAHGNEPSHHVAYYYNYIGQQHKCAEKVRYILREFYTADPDGIIGNEDAGQMSAWCVLSSLGLYQVDPCGGDFLIGSPAVKKAEITLGKGRVLTITVHNNSAKNVYVESVELNGKPYTKSYIPYAELVKGGTLDFYMSSVPTDFGTAVDDRP